jgi:hypothetical protein
MFSELREARKSLPFSLCAEHVRQLGGESPLPNLLQVGCEEEDECEHRVGHRSKWKEQERPAEGCACERRRVGGQSAGQRAQNDSLVVGLGDVPDVEQNHDQEAAAAAESRGRSLFFEFGGVVHEEPRPPNRLDLRSQKTMARREPRHCCFPETDYFPKITVLEKWELAAM